ncbi:hypothetical protein PYW08_015888 [Mythimna loreyi]|uniref:Uncharacterized protein n=1 Tax=Mythimna loreyi TaxID=667449 RepID=A0ACC2QRY3_9NEOP|nr:hypothetical protein PYW08_015888 [Mythimna loreyi]
MEFNLGFIGGGNMSTAIVKGIIKSGVHTASKIWVAGPHIENLKHWSDMGTNVTSENGVVFDNCDMIFLGVKVTKLQTAIQDIKLTAKSTAKEVLFVSMLAGIQIKDLHEVIQSHLPGVKASVIRIMPNTPMTVGAGICLYTPDSTVLQSKCLILEKLVSGSALCEKIPEELMDSLGALSACGPAYMYVIIEALADGAVKQGVPRAMAMRHAAQMVVGSGQMVLQSGKHPGLLKDEVCSPGGSTICGIAALEDGKLRATLIKAVELSTIRNKELGKK